MEKDKRSQQSLEKAWEDTDKAKQREHEAKEKERLAIMESAHSKVEAYKEKLSYAERLLEEKAKITEKYMNEKIEYSDKFRGEMLHVAQSIYDEKDRSFKQALTIFDEIVTHGLDAFFDHEHYSKNINKINEIKRRILKDNKEINDDLVIINNDIYRISLELAKEEAKYDKVVEIKDRLNKDDSKKELIKMSISILKITADLNDKELSLIKREDEKKLSDEKLSFIDDQLSCMERKDLDALSSIKSSFFAQKKINDLINKKTKSKLSSFSPDFLHDDSNRELPHLENSAAEIEKNRDRPRFICLNLRIP